MISQTAIKLDICSNFNDETSTEHSSLIEMNVKNVSESKGILT